jgi:hypothetical protein
MPVKKNTTKRPKLNPNDVMDDEEFEELLSNPEDLNTVIQQRATLDRKSSRLSKGAAATKGKVTAASPRRVATGTTSSHATGPAAKEASATRVPAQLRIESPTQRGKSSDDSQRNSEPSATTTYPAAHGNTAPQYQL